MSEDITPSVGQISHVREVIRVSGVEDVLVTDITEPIDGTYLRAIRIMGSDNNLIFELQLASTDPSKIKIPAPTTLDF